MMLSKAKNWWRERRERIAEKKAAEVDPPGVTIPAWLPKSIKVGEWGAYALLLFFVVQKVLSVAEDKYESLSFSHLGFDAAIQFDFYIPLVIGYVGAAAVVPWIAKFVIPLLVSLSFRTHFWAKSWALFITCLVSFVLITGTATVGGDALIESERDAAVAVAEVEQSRAVLQSRIEAAEAELADLRNHSNTYFAIAASMTPETYRRTYIEARRGDPQYDRFVSALGASEDAAALRERISGLRDQLAASGTTAAVSSTVDSERTNALQSLMSALNIYWLLAFASILDVARLLLPWLRMTVENLRNAQLGLVGGIPQHPWMIPDMRDSEGSEVSMSASGFDEAKVPMDPHYKGDTIYDEEGKELRWVQGHVREKDRKFIPGHYRPTGARRKQEIEVTVGGQTFTTDVVAEDKPATNDGGNRTAMTAAGQLGDVSLREDFIEQVNAIDDESQSHQESEGTESAHASTESDSTGRAEYVEQGFTDQTDSPSDDAIDAYMALDDAPVEAGDVDENTSDGDEPDQGEQYDLPDGGTVTITDEEPEREPETRPGRMIAAE